MELVVVMAVTLLLTGLMLPALTQVRENAHRVICSSNLRQIGIGAVLYADDTGSLPESFYGQTGQSKGEMMALHRGKTANDWEGLGWLWSWRYLDSPHVFYCPSHHGQHHIDEYEDRFIWPDNSRIYGNYHYAGDWDWEKNVPRRLSSTSSFVIATDGMRTVQDLNHVDGMNVLRSDNSVDWRDDIVQQVAVLLPGSESETSDDDEDRYAAIWKIINTEF